MSGKDPPSSARTWSGLYPAEWQALGSRPAARNILLPVHDDAGQAARLQMAIDLARAHGGRLVCVEVAAMPLTRGLPAAALLHDVLRTAGAAGAGDNCIHVQAVLAAAGVASTWINASAAVARELAISLADAVVVNRQPGELPAQADAADAAAVGGPAMRRRSTLAAGDAGCVVAA
jgi:hypothetical protein